MKIVKIGAMWCPGCLIMNKVWKKIEEDFNISITSYDYDMDEDIVKNYDVGSVLPVMIFYKDDKEYKRLIGEKKYEDIEKIILEMRDGNE